MYEKNLIFSIHVNVIASFEKVKSYFIENLRFRVYVFIIKYRVPVTHLSSQIYFLT